VVSFRNRLAIYLFLGANPKYTPIDAIRRDTSCSKRSDENNWLGRGRHRPRCLLRPSTVSVGCSIDRFLDRSMPFFRTHTARDDVSLLADTGSTSIVLHRGGNIEPTGTGTSTATPTVSVSVVVPAVPAPAPAPAPPAEHQNAQINHLSNDGQS
jgi:hypothetical protein